MRTRCYAVIQLVNDIKHKSDRKTSRQNKVCDVTALIQYLKITSFLI